MTAPQTEPADVAGDGPPGTPGPRVGTAQPVAPQVERILGGAADGVNDPIERRIAALEGLQRFLAVEYDALVEALHRDLGLSPAEAHVTELGPAIAEVDHVLDRIGVWTRSRRYGLPLALRPGTARGLVRPKGSVLVVAPSSSPVQQLLAPLATTLAAGNTAMLAPTATPAATARVIAERLGGHVDRGVVEVAPSDDATTAALVTAGFDHVVFSGGADAAGRVRHQIVDLDVSMTATIGTKNPAIVTPDADVTGAADRIALGKFAKAGQSCVAPDYVLVPRPHHQRFVDAIATAIRRRYGESPHTSPGFARIVSEAHVDRLASLLRGGGYQAVAAGGAIDRDARYVDPTVLAGVSHDAAVMHEEIFGPILPVLAYESLSDAIDFVGRRPRALVAHLFGARREIAQIVVGIDAGAISIDTALQPTPIPDAAAGGFGADRGEPGFTSASRLIPVVRRSAKLDARVLDPSRSRAAGRLIRRLY